MDDDERGPRGGVGCDIPRTRRRLQRGDDKWDVYWQTHTIDEHGAIIKAPQDS
ncbi:hypothetical protein OG586_31410 [Streptomyces murinus]|uniref:hypothetical protein n=1 Tax=Streptomyces murinus TaxID=33900 RepID=UPI002E805125|nr:hypothetical protein [Streptomyces murinus]WUD10436.1 hypothetical protein OG586_31410 [Streptomyces murinus]